MDTKVGSLQTPSADVEPLSRAVTGDVFFMNRNCYAMKDPLAIGLCLLTKTENRFDHVGMLVKISESDLERFPETRRRIVDKSPSDTYVLETNMNGITLYSAEKRVERSSAYELATRTVDIDSRRMSTEDGFPADGEQLNHRMLGILEGMYDAPYQDDFLAIAPSIFSPPDKMDRINAANKVNQLRMEIASLRSSLARHSTEDSDHTHAAAYRALQATYEKAATDILDIYFPHLQRTAPAEAVWDTGHLGIDGVNYSPKMVCTELIGNLWLRSGITNGYIPASSLRPFDFLDDSRFNFTERAMQLGSLVPLKVSKKYQRYWADSDSNTQVSADPSNAAAAVANDSHLLFYNELVRCGGLPGRRLIASLAELLPDGQSEISSSVSRRWLVQSSDQDCVRDLGARLFAVGVLFSFWALPCAPLTLRWVEGQVGLFLVRGSVWSLACGLLARNVAFATVQGLTAYALGAFVAAPRNGTGSTCHDVMRTNGPQQHCGDGAETLSPARRPFVDWRHPYYAVGGVVAASSVVAHAATQPILNGVLSHHFGPLRAGPLPRRLLMRGAYCLAPFSILLPMQGYFLSWYETCGSFVIPVRSSVLRPRQEFLERPDWPHFRNDALVGAFGAMVALDLLLYPFQTGVARSLIKDLYHPRPSPSIGGRLFPAYRYRFAANTIISGVTCATLSFVFHLL